MSVQHVGLAASSAAYSNPEPWPYHGTPAERADLFRKELLPAALNYAAKGYPVFPALLINGEKKPLVKWGKGEDGHADLTKRRASIDPETIRAWWARWPVAMIGMATGKPSGVVVLDVDRKNGVDGLANLRRAGIDPYSLTPIFAVTPSGGLHFFFKADARWTTSWPRERLGSRRKARRPGRAHSSWKRASDDHAKSLHPP